jgi:hypothetical protein
VEKISTGFKNWSRLSRLASTVQKTKSPHGLCPKVSIFVKVSIETVQKRTSRLSRKSRQFEKWCLDTSRSLDLDLDWSRQSRPPSLMFYPGRKRTFALAFASFTSHSLNLLNFLKITNQLAKTHANIFCRTALPLYVWLIKTTLKFLNRYLTRLA